MRTKNRRRTSGHHENIRLLRYGKGIRGWFRAYRTALTLLGSIFIAGLILGALSIAWQKHYGPGETMDELLFPEEPEHITLHQDPHVVDCFKVWTESPKGSCLLMVWSDGQVWSAYTDNPKTLGQWELLAHVRTGGTP